MKKKGIKQNDLATEISPKIHGGESKCSMLVPVCSRRTHADYISVGVRVDSSEFIP